MTSALQRPLFDYTVVDQPTRHRPNSTRDPHRGSVTRYAAPQLTGMESARLRGLQRLHSVEYPATPSSLEEPPHSQLWKILAGSLKVLTLVAAAGVGLFLYFHRDMANGIAAKSLALRYKLGDWYPLLFLIVHVLCVSCFVPAEFLTVCAGFIFTYQSDYGYQFGLAFAVAITMTSLTIVCSLHFFLGRYWLRSFAEKILGYSTVTAPVREVVNEGGFLAALVVRIVPVLPFALGSLLLGMTDLSPQVVIGSVFGALPLTTFFCWVGSRMSGLHSILEGSDVGLPFKSQQGTGLISLSLLILLLAVLYFGFLVVRLRRRRQQAQASTVGAGKESAAYETLSKRHGSYVDGLRCASKHAAGNHPLDNCFDNPVEWSERES